ncbi:MAG TPA: mechanosensitive ion channel domain-containing protein [Cyclobacteriaceae bacterium]
MVSSLTGICQSDKVQSESDTINVIKLAELQVAYKQAITEIPNMLQTSDSTELSSLEEELVLDAEKYSNIKSEADDILSGYLSPSRISSLERRFNRSHIFFEELSTKVAEKTASIENSLLILEQEKSNWNSLHDRVKTDTVYNNLLPTVEEVLLLISNTEKVLQGHLAHILAIQTETIKYQSEIPQYSQQLSDAKNLSFSRLFQRDRRNLWSKQEESDTIKQTVVKKISNRFVLSSSESFDYIAENTNTLFSLMIFGLGLSGLIFGLKKSYAPEDATTSSTSNTLIFRYPVSAAIILIILVIILSLSNRPTVITELLFIGFTIPVIIYSLEDSRRNRWIYWVIIGLYVLDSLVRNNFVHPSIALILLILGSLIALGGLYWMNHNRDKFLINPEIELAGYVKSNLTPFFFYLSAIIPVLILIGYVALAKLIFSGIITSLYLIPVILLCHKVIISLLFILSRTEVLSKSYLMKRYLPLIYKGVKMGAVLLWIKGFLNAFGLYEFFVGIGEAIWDYGGTFGELQVTIGGTLEIIIIIGASLFISNFIKVLLQEEVFSRFDVPRGVPMAMGVLGKYFIIVVGFFLGVASLGFDLSKMSILAGALGVGVGFGLQNLVSNFVSGLILIFERPILVGDTIEAEGFEGTVSEIGIRSSKIITYDGAEIVIPNANLISNSVSNWTMSNRRRRFVIEIRTNAKANPSEVIAVITDLAIHQAHVIKEPKPFVVFEGQKEQVLIFSLYYWQDGEVMVTRSELNAHIHNSLKSLGIELSIPVFEVKQPVQASK